MSGNTKRRKRVVSKLEYVGHVSKKAALSSLGGALFVTGLTGFCLSVAILIYILVWWLPFFSLVSLTPMPPVLWSLLGCVLGGAFCVLLGSFGLNRMRGAADMEPVIPFTRQNAEQMPAQESLVRAASEPLAPEENVLLRAAQYSQETPSEQLLRPHAPTGN